MDPTQNQQQQQTPVSPQPVSPPPVSAPPVSNPPVGVPPPPPQPVTPNQVPPPPHGSDNKILFILIGALSLVVLVILVFILLNRQAGPSQIPANVTPTVSQEAPTPSPTAEEDVESVDLGTVEAELKDIREDLEGLR